VNNFNAREICSGSVAVVNLVTCSNLVRPTMREHRKVRGAMPFWDVVLKARQYREAVVGYIRAGLDYGDAGES